MNQWYCGVEGQQYGPYTWEQMRAMAEEGRLVSESYVRREVDQQWMTAKQVPGLLKKKPKPSHSTSTQLSVAAVKKAAKTTTNAAARTSTAVAANGQAAEGSRIATVRPAAATASSSSAAIPVGAAVPPVGVAVAEPPASSPLGFVVQTTAPVKSAKSGRHKPLADDVEAAPKKSNSALLITVILAGVVLLMGVAGVGVLIWSGLGRGKSEVAKKETAPAAEVAANPSPAVEKNPVEVNPVEVNPVAGEVNPVTPAPAVDSVPVPAVATTETAVAKAAPAAAPSPTMPAAEAAAAVKVLKAQSVWNDVTRVPGITILEVGLKVNSVWLAADEAGTRVEPTEGNASGARFVFVELQLTNKAKAARPYKSWNSTAGSSVVLADAAGQPLGFVPTAATPSATRLGTIEIPAGKVLSDTLVFHAPSGSVEKLQLALAKSALAGTAKTRGSHFAFEIPHEVLLRGAPRARAPVDPAAEPAATPADAPPLDVTPPVPAAVTPALPVPAAPMPAAPPPPAKFDPSAFDKELQKENEPAKGEAPKADMPKAEAPTGDAEPVAPAKKGKAGKSSKLPRK